MMVIMKKKGKPVKNWRKKTEIFIHWQETSFQKVQHMIEKCLIFHMTKEECMEALTKHATIEPVITSTVWNELEKENKEFFEAYSQSQSEGADQMTSEMIQKMISDLQSKDSNI